MRIIKIQTPENRVDDIIKLVFDAGAPSANLQTVDEYRDASKPKSARVIEVVTSTPAAKNIEDRLLASGLFDQQTMSITTRQPHSVISSESFKRLTWPWVQPSTDIVQELWQFSHVTTGYVLRCFIAAGLLAYGLVHAKLLVMIAGMIFVPSLPLLLAIGFGAWAGEWDLARRAAGTLIVGLATLFLGGIAVGSAVNGPVQYNDFSSVGVSAVISAAVGVAAALAHSDDGGRKEMIGLAATAQIAVIPVWLGLAAILGVPPTEAQGTPAAMLWTLVNNILIVITSSLVTYIAIGAIPVSIRRIRTKGG
ncbi:MAG: hypothetical protein JO053_07490 [Acidobacteria bacterium]|nr:hypothetical protein [Acidobacteriota bacterium]